LALAGRLNTGEEGERFTAEIAESAEGLRLQISSTKSQTITNIQKANFPNPRIWVLGFENYLGFGIWYLKVSFFLCVLCGECFLTC
jgi:hypothetical protein